MFKNLANLANLGGLGSLGNLSNLMLNAHEMGEKMQEMSARLQQVRVVESAGEGLVTVEMNGMGQMLRLEIDATLIETQNRDLIQDLIPAAVNEAVRRVKEQHVAEMKSVTEGLGVNIPGLESALAKLTGAGA